MDGGCALKKHRSHHDVFRRADAGVIKVNFPCMHVRSVTMDEAPLFRHLNAKAAQTIQMQVNGAQANFTPAGISHRCLMESAENGTQQKNGRTNLLGQAIRHFPGM